MALAVIGPTITKYHGLQEVFGKLERRAAVSKMFVGDVVQYKYVTVDSCLAVSVNALVEAV